MYAVLLLSSQPLLLADSIRGSPRPGDPQEETLKTKEQFVNVQREQSRKELVNTIMLYCPKGE